MISYTSILAYKSLLEDLERTEGQRRQVYLAVKDWCGQEGPSRDDVAQVTGLRLSSVCGRVAELLAAGVLLRGPMKLQSVVPGSAQHVETLIAHVYHSHVPLVVGEPQLGLFD